MHFINKVCVCVCVCVCVVRQRDTDAAEREGAILTELELGELQALEERLADQEFQSRTVSTCTAWHARPSKNHVVPQLSVTLNLYVSLVIPLQCGVHNGNSACLSTHPPSLPPGRLATFLGQLANGDPLKTQKNSSKRDPI